MEAIGRAAYEDNRWERTALLRPALPIEAVLSIQALIMQTTQRQERSVLRGDKRHGFAALNTIHTAPDEVYDDSLEEYLACRVAKVSHDQWRMRVRFRQNQLSEETKDTSYVDDYSFDWLRNGNTQAWHATVGILPVGDAETREEWRMIAPIGESEAVQLEGRIRNHMILVGAARALARSRQS